MKVCRKCKETLDFSCFHKSKKNKDGHQAYCKQCANAAVLAGELQGKYKKTTEQRRRYKQNHRAKNPDKFRARHLLDSHIRNGSVVRGNCQVCGKEKSEAHHHDYSRPLDVVWLCKEHHLEAHNKQQRKNK